MAVYAEATHLRREEWMGVGGGGEGGDEKFLHADRGADSV